MNPVFVSRVTGSARYLERRLTPAGTPGATALRLARTGAGWSLRAGREQGGDAVLGRNGRPLLVMAPEVAEELGDDVVIDLVSTGRGFRLVVSER